MTAVVVGTVAPVAVATASASQSTTASLARTAGDPAQTGIVKTSLAGFSAGNIISDAVFTNKSTMTEAQIQSFFNGKVSRCQSGYVCLKDFKISSVNRPADAYCSGYTGAANESAARIIYRVAQSCNINPQVLIVMLQKEQGLISHTWPSSWRYDSALGQGCPDTAPCDPNFVGFFHQIYGAARQMQIYMEGKWFQWYAPGKTWGILYHPNASCGRGNVYVANKATAALYYYTPYQPNAAALKAGYGEGNSCSSYGNRNFYNYFTDWFGSTQVGVPTAPKPTLGSVDKSSYVVAATSDGAIWGYPFENGYWGDKVRLATSNSNTKSAFVVGDLDGDGHRDVVAVDSSNRLSLLPGTGDGFGQPEPIRADWSSSVLQTAAGDFDGDGVPDTFTTDSSGKLMLWRGNDLGGFRSPVVVGTGWNNMNLIIGGRDFTKDGRPDLLARDNQGRLFMYAGDGNGKWAVSKQIGQGWQSMSAILNVGDFSGDRQPDLLARDGSGRLWLYKGIGGGALASGGQVGTGWQTFASIQSSGDPVEASRVLTAAAGDMDGDGAPDVTAVTASGDLMLYSGDGRGGWRGSAPISSGWANSRLVPLGEFDGSGERDLGRIDQSGVFYLYRGTSPSGLSNPVQIGHGWAGVDLVIGGLDFDGDRHTDVIGRGSDGNLTLYRGNGAGGWSQNSVIGKGWTSIDSADYVGDFDGDGAGDIVARRDDGTLWLYPTTGTGGWGTPRQIGKGWGSLELLFSPGDFDGDGLVDVLARNTAGELVLYSGNGLGGWLGSRPVGRGWTAMAQLG
ncbi:FG-GAP repeat domain-containing protein [Microbacterium profundi]